MTRRRLRRGIYRGAGLLLGVAADALVGDPQRWHPVAGFGRVVGWLEQRIYDDSRWRGLILTATAVSIPTLATALLARRARTPAQQIALTAGATWTVLGARSLRQVATIVAQQLGADDMPAARETITNLVGRDPSHLDTAGLARAAVESVAENTCDAVVAPLVAGAVAGAPGLVAYRAINTLDAMVGYRNSRYERFGWAAARLDDVANLLPARLTTVATVVAAALTPGMSGQRAWQVALRDARAHPSPNSGWGEAAFAGALGRQLGGRNVYGTGVEDRPLQGDGPPPQVADIGRGARLAQRATWVAAAMSAAIAVVGGRRA